MKSTSKPLKKALRKNARQHNLRKPQVLLNICRMNFLCTPVLFVTIAIRIWVIVYVMLNIVHYDKVIFIIKTFSWPYNIAILLHFYAILKPCSPQVYLSTFKCVISHRQSDLLPNAIFLNLKMSISSNNKMRLVHLKWMK